MMSLFQYKSTKRRAMPRIWIITAVSQDLKKFTDKQVIKLNNSNDPIKIMPETYTKQQTSGKGDNKQHSGISPGGGVGRPLGLRQAGKSASSLRYLSPQSSTTTWNNMSLDQDSSEIFQQIQELNKDVDSTVQFVRGVNEILCTTTTAIVLLFVFGIFTIGEIIVGFHYLEKCPLEHRIPIFLFVDGCFGLLKTVHLLGVNYRLRNHSSFTSDSFDYDRQQRANQIVDVALNLFLIIWQIVGTVWIFSICFPLCQAPLHEPNNWCDCFMYTFALVEVGLFSLVILGTLVFQTAIIMCYKYTNLFES